MTGVEARRTAICYLSEMAALIAIFIAVDFLVLRYVFPGFIDPFWPQNSDFYSASAIKNSPYSFWGLLMFPRPLGIAYMWLTGNLGIRGSIVANLLLVAINYALIVMSLRRAFKISIGVNAIACALLFAFLISSHPYQYQMSTWDSFSQLSFFLFLIAFVFISNGATPWLAAIFVLLAPLAKETYLLSAIFLCAVWAVENRFRMKSLIPGLAIGVAGVVALAFEHFVSSPFTNGADPQGAYHVVLSVSSVSKEWFRYLSEGVNAATLCVVFLSIIAVAVGTGLWSREFLWAFSLPIAGALALLPNSLLPNHHSESYTWNAAFLMYAPVIMLCVASRKIRFFTAIPIAIGIVALYSPVLSAGDYAGQNWIIADQQHQKKFMKRFGDLIKEIPSDDQNILISGVNFPSNIFENKNSVYSFGVPSGTHLFVVSYDAEKIHQTQNGADKPEDLITFISPEDVPKMAFNEAWLVRNDGDVIMRLQPPYSIATPIPNYFALAEILAFPGLLDVFDASKSDNSSVDGYTYLKYGTLFLDYNRPSLAEIYLRRAEALLPENPYSHYFLGKSLERQGDIDRARGEYLKAVETQAASPNPAFQKALDRIR
ncbi:tetratricopeptide repeat protein [Trinickia violacea]|uniref:Tetratricopeptide repeat protein n=1 Tax=Trinickia violacea TaxID=2571746 RepID=A0A4P8ISN8_9BURK|nr:tetratricopeptide repeat protein [Trinickia violacea]QCP50765.1 tetratricopeptide repeat protein [Trinickia violacea]